MTKQHTDGGAALPPRPEPPLLEGDGRGGGKFEIDGAGQADVLLAAVAVRVPTGEGAGAHQDLAVRVREGQA